MFQDTEPIKLALLDQLKNISSPDHSIRTKAEEELSQLKVTDGYGMYLAEILLDDGLDFDLRQLASVMLKQYAEESWAINDESEQLHPQASGQTKKTIKSILPKGLYDPNSKMRSAVVSTISTIACLDWRNYWVELFDTLNSIVKSKEFQQNVICVLTDLIYIIIIYMQVTEEQETDWNQDCEKFVEGEADSGVRSRAQDILSIIGEEFGETMLPPLSEAIKKHVAVADANRAAGHQNWWKIHEASMLAVGSCKGVIKTHESLFNLGEYLNRVRGLLHQNNVSPYLTGRCLRILSQYVDSNVYNTQMLNELIGNVQNALGPEQDIILKICATQSIGEICSNLKECNEEQRQCVLSKLVELFDGIFPIIEQSQHSLISKTIIEQSLNTTIGMTLETFAAMLSFDQGFTVEISGQIIPLSIDMFLKYPDDDLIFDMVQDVMKILLQNPFCSHPLQEKLIPTIVSVLNVQGEHANLEMQKNALDVIETVVQYSQTPLSDTLMESAYFAALSFISHTEDQSVIQSGVKCLHAILQSTNVPIV